MKRFLLIGQTGQIGWELERTLSVLGKVIAVDIHNFDLTDPTIVRSTVEQVKPDAIINAAAYTAVDKAESERELAFQVNSQGPAFLAEEALRNDALLIHYSTDYVFDGSSTIPYEEDAQTGPLSAYGESKLAGEQAIIQTGCKHLIFRTSWVYGARGKNFMLTMLNLAQSRKPLSIVNDQVGAPTWSRSIAEGTAQALAKALCHPSDSLWGVYHMTCSGQTTWYQFAETIFREYSKKEPSFVAPTVTPIMTDQYPLPAQRPKNSLLSCQKLAQQFCIALPSWQDALELCLQERFT